LGSPIADVAVLVVRVRDAAVNYYERHLGDYAKDTAHLSMIEHGAYTLLLDRYYGTEEPIPAEQTYRVARAHTKEERAAVDTVLREFFILQETHWVHGRCQEEIEKAHKRITAARTNGVKGGRPKPNPEQTQQEPTGLSLGSVSVTQTKALQSPDSNLHVPVSREGERTRGARLPPGWELTPERKAIAETQKLDPERTFAKFTAYWEAASGRTASKRNWDAAWRYWCTTEADRKPLNGSGTHASAAPIRYRTAEEYEAEERARGDHDEQH